MTNIQGAIEILRKATTAVKIAPFAYAGLFLVALLVYLFFNDTISTIADLLFYASPVCVVYNLWLSNIFKLCKWHKLECCLPLFPLVAIFLDSFVCPFGELSGYINFAVDMLIFLLSLINAYFVFIKPRNEESNS